MQSYWQYLSLQAVLATEMPPSISTFFGPDRTSNVYTAGNLVQLMQTEFSSGQGPAWFSSMPADAQTYFMTRYMQIVEYDLD